MMEKHLLTEFITKLQTGDVSTKDFIGLAKQIETVSTSQSLAAYNGSLDAAFALHIQMLSDDWEWNVGDTSAALYAGGIGDGELISESNSFPSRAWLIAILRALLFHKELKE